MNRDELLQACFGDAELKTGKMVFERTDEATETQVVSHVDLGYKRILIRTPTRGAGAAIADASTMVTVATIANVCTDPAERGKGYARETLERAHAEAASHALVGFAALFAGDEIFEGLYRKLGYFKPAGGPDHFYVRPLREGEKWPEGTIDTLGLW